MYCKYCGNKLDNNAIFCVKCGKKIEDAENVNETLTDTAKIEHKEKKSGKIVAIVVIAVVFIGIITISLVLLNNPYYHALCFGNVEEKFAVAMKIEQERNALIKTNYPYSYEKKTMKLLKKAADAGFEQACFKLAESYELRADKDKDVNLAIGYYKKAADMGNATAALRVGKLADDWNISKAYYRKAGEAGLGEGWYHLAGSSRAEKDFETALIYYNRAVQSGYKDALYDMGYVYYYELNDYKNGLLCLKEAVENNNTEAMCLLGFIGFENKDYNLSRVCYQMASDLDDKRGKRNLGFLYFKGYGVKRDYQMSISLFKEASSNAPTSFDNKTELGRAGKEFSYVLDSFFSLGSKDIDILSYADMIYFIGYMTENGLGTSKDIDSACAWYEYAATLGQDDAKAVLEKLNNN